MCCGRESCMYCWFTRQHLVVVEFLLIEAENWISLPFQKLSISRLHAKFRAYVYQRGAISEVVGMF
jgi:hypothetical protein